MSKTLNNLTNHCRTIHFIGNFGKSIDKIIGEDLAALEAGELEELTQFHGGFHGVT